MSASMVMLTTAVAISAMNSSQASGGSGSCPVSDFGATCLIIFGALIATSAVTLILAFTRNWSSKWGDRWLLASVALWVASLIPIVVGLVHDC